MAKDRENTPTTTNKNHLPRRVSTFLTGVQLHFAETLYRRCDATHFRNNHKPYPQLGLILFVRSNRLSTNFCYLTNINNSMIR